MKYTLKDAKKVLANLKAEEGNYSYKSGFPCVFEDICEIYIVSGSLAKESEKKDGPYYVNKWVKDSDIFIVDDSNDEDIVYRIRDAEDVLHFMNGETDNLEIERREVFWC